MRMTHHYRGELTEGRVRLLLKDNVYEVARIEVNAEAAKELIESMSEPRRNNYTIGAPLKAEDDDAVAIIINERLPAGQLVLEVR